MGYRLEKISKLLNDTSFRLLLALIVIFIGGMFYMHIIKPNKMKAEATASAISDISATNAVLQEQKTKLSRQNKDKHIKSSAAAANRALPADLLYDEQLLEYNKLASKAGVKISTIAPGELTPGDPVGTFPVSFTLTGSKASLLNFMKIVREQVKYNGGRLTASGPIWVINNVAYTPGSITISVTILYKSNKAAATPVTPKSAGNTPGVTASTGAAP